ncbi:MAG: hypothetical protein KJ606_10320 [Chloroflexi bacterium]|nr:hypothetical protein [Chloroflexota bacterium]
MPKSNPHKFNHWVYREQPAQQNPLRLLLLLHGWTGDENSMWFFSQHLPPNYWRLAPRGPYPSAQGGYSWREVIPATWGLPSIEDLRPSAEALIEFIDDWAASTSVDAAQFDVMGFSQGAALSYTLALLYPQRVHRLAALAGFVPLGGEELSIPRPLAGKPIFVAHGAVDKLIPIERARESVAILKTAGAQVTFCEAEVGHKVGGECLRGLDEFFS